MKKIYSLSILVFTFSAFQTKANIIYTDVNPDAVNVGNSTQDIDVDNDLTIDFRITGAQSGNFSFDIVQATQVGVNNFVLTDGAGNASALALNTLIGPLSTTWFQMNSTNAQMMSVFNSVGSGTWCGVTDKYLGLQFITNSITYFGWARFTFDVNTNMYTFKDYAYESNANTPILAGQMLTGTSNLILPESSVNVFPNPAHNILTLNSTVILSQTSIQLLSVTGELIYSSSSENFQTVNINVSGFAKGIYLLKTSNENGILTKKIIIE